jgi:phage baseplate assembly protein V
MMTSILDLLAPPPPDGRRIHGVVTGVVTNNTDEKKLGRVKVRFDWLADTYETDWARVAVPMAGKERGMWLIPAVGDEVLVAFEQGDMSHPYVVGSLWSQTDGPPKAGAEAGSEATVLHSRSGHVVRLDDREGKERIEITDRSGKNSIVLSTKDNAIILTCEGDLTLESRGGKVVVKGAKGVDVASDAAVQAEAGADMGLRAKGAVKVKGTTIDLN